MQRQHFNINYAWRRKCIAESAECRVPAANLTKGISLTPHLQYVHMHMHALASPQQLPSLAFWASSSWCWRVWWWKRTLFQDSGSQYHTATLQHPNLHLLENRYSIYRWILHMCSCTRLTPPRVPVCPHLVFLYALTSCSCMPSLRVCLTSCSCMPSLRVCLTSCSCMPSLRVPVCPHLVFLYDPTSCSLHKLLALNY